MVLAADAQDVKVLRPSPRLGTETLPRDEILQGYRPPPNRVLAIEMFLSQETVP